MPFRIIRDDLARVEADAIVNTANPAPLVGAGTDLAVHRAAGPELLEARKRIGAIEPGCSAATPAFRLRAKYVLHTVGPVWVDGQHGEEALLRRAYGAALTLADELGCRSVAFPLMAAGSYGFPRDLALSTAIGAFTDFLLEHEMQILLVLYNTEAFGLASSLFDDLKSYIDDNYVAERCAEDACFEADFARFNRSEAPRRPPYRPAAAPRKAAGALPAAAPPAPALKVSSLEELLKTRETSFSEYLLDLLRERSGKDSEVYKRAEISKQLFSKILSNRDYQPTKSTAIQLALGLELDLPRTQKLLEKAGYALTRSSKTDLVVQYYIERRIYSVSFINEALYDCGLPLLKTGLKN
ncbi:MAG: macro domain-containing protein [Oscillospiraceae bacterium]|nr:macro domain-containing protein [Oscillospiraceae bacterium]